MRSFIRKALCVLLIVFIPAVSLAGTIDKAFTILAGTSDHAIGIQLTGEAIHIPSLSAQRTEWLNMFLKHVSLDFVLDSTTEKESLLLDGKEVISLTTHRNGSSEEHRFSFEEDTVYSSSDIRFREIPSNLFFTNHVDYYSDILLNLDEFYLFFSGLPDLFPEYSSLSKVNIRYKDYGTAVIKYSVTLPEDAFRSDRMTDYLARDEMKKIRPIILGMTFSGRQRFTILADENNRLMKVNYTGKAGLSETDMRSVNLDWRCLRRTEGYKDVLQLKTPAISGTNRHNLMIERELVIDSEFNEQYSCSIETDKVASRVRERTTLLIHLSTAGNHIEGEISEKTVSGGTVKTIALTGMAEQNQNEYAGSIEIKCELDKIEKEHLLIHFVAGAHDPLEWQQGRSVPMKDEDINRLSEKMASLFVNAMVNIPEGDLMYFLADLPEGWWSQTVRKIQNAEVITVP